MTMANANVFGPQGWTPKRLGNLKGKTYVITGANAGAGYEASKILLSRGAEVVMLNRNAQKSLGRVFLPRRHPKGCGYTY